MGLAAVFLLASTPRRTLTVQVGHKQLDLGLKILENAAVREDNLSNSGDEDQADLIVRLSSEYYLLRISIVRLNSEPLLVTRIVSLTNLQSGMAPGPVRPCGTHVF